MATLKSFISERTAEYIILPDLCRRLRPTFPKILPFFFWSTREGNAVSNRQMQNTTIRVLTVFARRPKISDAHPGQITMKLNRSILDYAHESANSGMPVIGALPLASSLNTLHTKTCCVYLDLNAQPSGRDVLIKVGQADGGFDALGGDAIAKLLQDSQQLSWVEVTERLSFLRAVHLKHNYPYFGGYRPIHLAVQVRRAGRARRRGRSRSNRRGSDYRPVAAGL